MQGHDKILVQPWSYSAKDCTTWSHSNALTRARAFDAAPRKEKGANVPCKLWCVTYRLWHTTVGHAALWPLHSGCKKTMCSTVCIWTTTYSTPSLTLPWTCTAASVWQRAWFLNSRASVLEHLWTYLVLHCISYNIATSVKSAQAIPPLLTNGVHIRPYCGASLGTEKILVNMQQKMHCVLVPWVGAFFPTNAAHSGHKQPGHAVCVNEESIGGIEIMLTRFYSQVCKRVVPFWDYAISLPTRNLRQSLDCTMWDSGGEFNSQEQARLTPSLPRPSVLQHFGCPARWLCSFC